MFTVTNLNNSGEGSLRQAIFESNICSKIITFQVSGSIKLESSLPKISNRIYINGKSAPNYTKNPIVQINCNNFNGLILSKFSDYSEIVGLSIINSNSNNKIDNNFIGIDFDGVTEKPYRKNGIYLHKCKNNIIGSNPTLKSKFVANLISGNFENGILLYKSSNNIFQKNFIGTDFTGKISIPNLKNGILFDKSSNNIIGGKVFMNEIGIINNPTGSKGTTTPVYIILPLANLISENLNNGVYISNFSENNFLYGNYIGTNYTGNDYLGNGNDGVLIGNSNYNNVIGCNKINDPFVYYNVISGNNKNGLHITNSNYILIQANFFGIGGDSKTIVSNKLNGLLFDGNSSNIKFGGVIPLGNCSAGNGLNGIKITDTVKNTVTFNLY